MAAETQKLRDSRNVRGQLTTLVLGEVSKSMRGSIFQTNVATVINGL